jgi:hypothetical protein
MIFFSKIYRENQSILSNYWLKRYFNFKEFIKRIRRMVKELLRHNPLIDYNEAVRILKLDNSETLRPFSHDKLKRYSLR